MRTALLLGSLLAAGCGMEFEEGERLKPLESTTVTEDLRSARDLPAGAVPRTAELGDESLKTGIGNDGYLAAFPAELSAELVERGRERFSIYCTPCHGAEGEGDGPVVSRGFPEPESLKSSRLRTMPPGYFVHTIDQGFGRMPSYDSITIPDRWAIAAFILSLQDREPRSTTESGETSISGTEDSSSPPSGPPLEGQEE